MICIIHKVIFYAKKKYEYDAHKTNIANHLNLILQA